MLIRMLRARLLLVLLPLTAAAQATAIVRGDVFLPDSATRAAGVIVEVSDLSGAAVGRGLTTERGRFQVTLPKAGRYAARVLRIGFRPTPVPAFDVVAGAPTELRIVLGGDPVRLESVKVSADEACRIRADSGKLVAQVWEETRKALSSADLSQLTGDLVVDGFTWHSVRDDRAQELLWQTIEPITTSSIRPFVSPAPEVLAAEGYARTYSATGMELLGPEAGALISDAFAAGHCFRLTSPPADRAGWIGVSFRPVHERRGVVEIAGTFWVDAKSAELRLLEYRYTNGPLELDRAHGGGRVEFVRLASGEWLLNRWSIRGSTITERKTVSVFAGARTVPRTREVSSTALSISGGEVHSVKRDGVELYHDSGPGWHATFSPPLDGPRGAGATVEFLDLPYFAYPDSAAAAALDFITPGVHEGVVSTWATRVLGVPPKTLKVEMAAGKPAATAVDLAPEDSVLKAACGSDAIARERAALYGVLIDPNGAPVREYELTIRYTTPAERINKTPLEKQRPVTFSSDALGRWKVCGLPRGGAFVLTREREGEPVSVIHEGVIDPKARLVPLSLKVLGSP